MTSPDGPSSAFRRRCVARRSFALHPWGELVLAVALVVLGGVLGELAALAALALMAAYLWLVVAAWRRGRDASCACFGARRPITVVTVVRNVWLTIVALVTVATIWTNPLLGGAARRAHSGGVGVDRRGGDGCRHRDARRRGRMPGA